jgi:hypothetical protein
MREGVVMMTMIGIGLSLNSSGRYSVVSGRSFGSLSDWCKVGMCHCLLGC